MYYWTLLVEANLAATAECCQIKSAVYVESFTYNDETTLYMHSFLIYNLVAIRSSGSRRKQGQHIGRFKFVHLFDYISTLYKHYKYRFHSTIIPDAIKLLCVSIENDE